MKKIVSILLSLVLVISLFTACGDKEEGEPTSNKDTINIVTTVFPVYDWTRNIVGEDNKNVNVDILLKDGVDLHNYQPSADDMAKIAEADVFIYVGGSSDVWVDDALKNAVNEDMKVINLFDVLKGDLKPLKVVEGMEHHHEHECEDDVCEHTDAMDEHIWLSPRRAIKCVNAIAEEIANVDSENKAVYEENRDTYITALEDMDKAFESAVKEGKRDTVVFGDRFPFFYMADDYGLNYFAAFTGCSAESEASFETVAFLSKKIDELGVKKILTIEKRMHKIPETIIENTKDKNQEILELNSMQSINSKDMEAGITYIDIMKSNLEVLKEALK